jgi:ABC-type transporter MlaC component
LNERALAPLIADLIARRPFARAVREAESRSFLVSSTWLYRSDPHRVREWEADMTSLGMIRFRIARVALFALFVDGASLAQSAEREADARDLIRSLGETVVATLNAGADKARREALFREMYRRHFNHVAIAGWAAGRAYVEASPEERAAFLATCEDYIVKAYAAQLARYRGERLRVEKAETDGEAIVVTSKLVDPDPRASRDIEMKWRLFAAGDRLLVSDVVVDKISMALTEKRAFSDWLKARGDKLPGLTSKLQEKIAQIDAD